MSNFIGFSLPSQLLAELKTQAKQQNISVCMLIRKVLQEYLSTRPVSMNVGGQTIHLNRVNLNEPVAYMTPQEEKLAGSILKRHFEEDREEFL